MPHPTTLIGRLCYAAICGIVVFLIVLAIGLLILHFLSDPQAQKYGNTVTGLAVVLGLLYAGYVFFSGRTAGPVV
jgi:exosortase/archaeosortase